jgi:hypothetical protein
MISDYVATQFSMMISDSEGMFAMSNTCVTRGISVVDDFGVRSDSVNGYDF